MTSPPPAQQQVQQWAVQLFGPMRIEADGCEVRIPAGRARSLLAYLLLYPGVARTRDEVMDALWPDLPTDRARRTLSDTLYRLRDTPVGAWIRTEGEEIALVDALPLHVDLWQFESSAQASDPATIDNVLTLAAAPLLPEIYDDWIIARRSALHDAWLVLLHRRAGMAEAQNDFARALALYQQIIDGDSFDEAGWRGRMRCLARTKHLRDALDAYARLEKLLQEELGSAPAAETTRLAEQIRRELDVQHVADPGLPFFVGRVYERSQLVAALDDAIAGRGAINVILADPGMGRTALLRELEQSARWRGVQVAWGMGSADAWPQPYAPLRQALQAALPAARMQQLSHLVHAQSLAATRLLLAAAQARLPAATSSQPAFASAPASHPSIVRTVQELAFAIANILRALGQIVPHLILLDDMQWADQTLWELLDELRLHLGQSRVLIVLSSRRADASSVSAMHDRLTTWDQEGATPIYTLNGLSRPELEQMLAHHNLSPPNEDALSALHQDAAGNPLLALALAAAAHHAAPNARAHPDEQFATSMLLHRFRALGEGEREALELCAVLGTHFTWQHWAALWNAAGNNPAQLPLLAGQLEQQQHLHLDGAGYRFSSAILQSAIHAQLEPARRQRLHQHAFDTLHDDADIPASQALHHALHAGLRDETFRRALLAGKAALAAYSSYSARDYFTLAHEHAHLADRERCYDLFQGRSAAYGLLGMRSEQLADLEQMHALAEALDDDARRTEVAYHQARYWLAVGKLDEALAVATRGLERATRAELPARAVRLHEMLMAIQRERKQHAASTRHFEEARRLFLALEDAWGVASVTDARGGLAWDVGDYAGAARDHLEAANLFRAAGDILREARALNNLGTAYWELGDYAGARTTHERALQVCRAAGDQQSEGDNIDNLGGVYWSLGDYDSAIHHYSEALRIRRAIQDQWGIGISLGNLGSACQRAGNLDEALRYYNEAYTYARKIGRRRSEGYLLHNIGVTRLQMGDDTAALDALSEALAIREEVGDTLKVIETCAALAITHLRRNDDDTALQCIQRALALLDKTEHRELLQQEVHCAAYQVFEALGDEALARHHLGNAELAMEQFCETLPADARALFLANVPLNRLVLEALPHYATSHTVQCAHVDAPRGRALRADELVTLRWTTETPGDALLADPAQRRQRVIRRLLNEAAQRNAAPTDDALANALGVSRRTILRDITALQDAGVAIATRFRA